MNTLERLKELQAAATPGPWEIDTTRSCPEIRTSVRRVAKALYHEGSEDSEVEANAELIVTLHNALPDLIEVVEAIKAERDWINAGKMTRCYLGDKSIDAGELIALGKKVDAALAKLTEEEG